MLSRTQKEEQIADLRDRFGRATSVFVADYRGLSVDRVNELRAKLRTSEAGGEVDYRVAKNAVLRRAAADSPIDVLTDRFTVAARFLLRAGKRPHAPPLPLTVSLPDLFRTTERVHPDRKGHQ